LQVYVQTKSKVSINILLLGTVMFYGCQALPTQKVSVDMSSVRLDYHNG